MNIEPWDEDKHGPLIVGNRGFHVAGDFSVRPPLSNPLVTVSPTVMLNLHVGFFQRLRICAELLFRGSASLQ